MLCFYKGCGIAKGVQTSTLDIKSAITILRQGNYTIIKYNFIPSTSGRFMF